MGIRWSQGKEQRLATLPGEPLPLDRISLSSAIARAWQRVQQDLLVYGLRSNLSFGWFVPTRLEGLLVAAAWLAIGLGMAGLMMAFPDFTLSVAFSLKRVW